MSNSRHDRNKIFSSDSGETGIQKRDILLDDFGWEIPVESVPIPSKGKIYPSESSLSGRERINIKAMTAKEEDILTSRALMSSGTVIDELIKACVTDSDVDVSDMLSGDRTALMVAIRITGYGPDYKLRATCPGCGKSDQYTFNLADMPLKRLDIDPISPGSNRFEYKLPVSKKTVHFKFLTGRDNDLIDEEANNMSRLFPEDYIGSTVTRRLKFSVISIDGIEDKNKTFKFIENMPAMDSKSLRTYIKKYEPGIDMVGKLNCKSCAKRSEVSLPIGASFFWPNI